MPTHSGVPGDVTRLLNAIADRDSGDGPETEALLLQQALHRELRCIVQRASPADRARHDTNSLVNAVYLRLAESGVRWNNRAHFFGAAAIALRRILVDVARARHAAKRGGGWDRVDLVPDQIQTVCPDPTDLLVLSDALEALEQLDDRRSRVVHLRLFAGLGTAEIADLLDVSRRTIERDWDESRVWLYSQVAGATPETGDST